MMSQQIANGEFALSVRDKINAGLASIDALVSARVRHLTIAAGSTASAWVATTASAPTVLPYDTSALYLIAFTSAPAAAATIAIDGLTALPIQDRKGSALQAGDIPINEAFLARVISGAFRLFHRFPSAQPVADPTVVTLHESFRTRDLTVTGSGTTFTAVTNGGAALTAYNTSGTFIVQFPSAPSAGAKLAVDGLTALPIQDRKGAALQDGDIGPNEAFLARVRSGGLRLYTRFTSAQNLPVVLNVDKAPMRLTLDGASTATALVATTTPAFTSFSVNQLLYLRCSFGLAPGVTIAINGLAALGIKDAITGLPINPADLTVNATYVGIVQFGGFQLLNVRPVPAISGEMAEPPLASPLPLPAALSRIGLQAYGQSLEAGYRRTADVMPRVLTTTAMYGGRTFAAGPRSGGTDLESEIGLIETAAYPYTGGGDVTSYGETGASGFVYGFTRAAHASFGYVYEDGPGVFAANAARGSTGSASLVPTDHPNFNAIGTEPVQPFDLLKAQVTAAKALADAAGEGYALYCLTCDQGQGEEPGGTLRAKWLENWLAIYDGISAHARTTTGQTFDPMMLFSQVYAGTRVHDGQSVADAQRDLETSRPGRCFMFMPIHHLATKLGYNGVMMHSDGHLTARGAFYVGAMRGRAWAESLYRGIEPPRMRPISAGFDGAAVTLRLRAPTLPVVIDTSESVIGVGRVRDAGLALVDGTGLVPLTSVVVGADGASVVLTPGRALSGTVRLRGGRDYLAPPPGTPTWTAGGNAYSYDYSSSAVLALRDSTTDMITVDGVAYPAAHWCPSFDLRVSDLR